MYEIDTKIIFSTFKYFTKQSLRNIFIFLSIILFQTISKILHYLSMDDAPEMELFLLLVVRGVTVLARMWAGILYSWADLSSFFNCSISSSKKVFSFSFRKCSCRWFLFSFSIWLLREETDLELYKESLNVYRRQIPIKYYFEIVKL